MRVLITGHLGYIGSLLVPAMLDAGYEVHGMDCDLFSDSDFVDGPRQVPTTWKDIRDVECDDLEGFDSICHLAALSNDALGNINPELTKAINLDASVRLAEMAKSVGVKKFVFASSCSNYGKTDGELVSESSVLNPLTPYGLSKVRVEQELDHLRSDSFCPVSLRFATAFGSSPRLRLDLVLNDFVATAVTTGEVRLMSQGTQFRPLVHVRDIVAAYVAALETEDASISGAKINIGSTEENFSIFELAQIVAAELPPCSVWKSEDAGVDDRTYRVSFDYSSKVLPTFKTEWNVRAGIQELADRVRKASLTEHDLTGPKYRRIAQLKQMIAEGKLDHALRRSREGVVE